MTPWTQFSYGRQLFANAADNQPAPGDPHGNPTVGDLYADRFALRDHLGGSAWWNTFAAVDQNDERWVAIRIPTPRTVRSGLFDEVAETARTWRSNWGLLSTIDIGSGQQSPYIARTIVNGSIADELLFERFELSHAVTILQQTAAELDGVHDSGGVHGRLHTGQIVYENVDGVPRVAVVDWTPASQWAGQPGPLVLTHRYVAPEVLLDRPVTPAADIYALAHIAFAMFSGSDASLGFHRTGQLRPPPITTFDRPETNYLYDVIAEGLAANPARRPATASGFAESVAVAVDELHRATDWQF